MYVAPNSANSSDEKASESPTPNRLSTGHKTILTVSLGRQFYPDVYIKLSSSTSDIVERGVVEGKFCLGLIPLPAEHEEVQSLALLSDEVVVAVHSKHLLASRKSISPMDLNEVPMVLAAQNLIMWRGISYLQDHGVSLKVIAESEEIDGVYNLLRLNDCVSLLPRTLVPSELISTPLNPTPPLITAGFVWTRLTPAAREFLKLVQPNMVASKG